MAIACDTTWETVHYAIRDSVRISVTNHCHTNILIFHRAEPKVMHMLASSCCGWSGRWFAHYLDNFSASLLDFGEERAVKPRIIIDNLACGPTSYRSMEGVRILCCRMVAPYDHIIDFVDMNTCFIRNLTDSSALIESSQCTEVLFRNRWCVVRADQGICVRRIANYYNLYTFLSHLVYSCSLSLEYFCVGLKEIRSLHAFTSRPRSNKHSHITVFEAY